MSTEESFGMALSRDGSGSTNTPVAAISQLPKLSGDELNTPGANGNVARQITLTQILTQDGSVTTAVVTLDRGAPPSEAPPPPDRSSGGSESMPPHTIGLIVGITVGIVVLLLLIACCCVVAHRRYADGDSDHTSDGRREECPDGTGPAPAMYRYPREYQRSAWRFPRSIPPPTLRPGQMPDYRATEFPQTWNANT